MVAATWRPSALCPAAKVPTGTTVASTWPASPSVRSTSAAASASCRARMRAVRIARHWFISVDRLGGAQMAPVRQLCLNPRRRKPLRWPAGAPTLLPCDEQAVTPDDVAAAGARRNSGSDSTTLRTSCIVSPRSITTTRARARRTRGAGIGTAFVPAMTGSTAASRPAGREGHELDPDLPAARRLVGIAILAVVLQQHAGGRVAARARGRVRRHPLVGPRVHRARVRARPAASPRPVGWSARRVSAVTVDRARVDAWLRDQRHRGDLRAGGERHDLHAHCRHETC